MQLVQANGILRSTCEAALLLMESDLSTDEDFHVSVCAELLQLYHVYAPGTEISRHHRLRWSPFSI